MATIFKIATWNICGRGEVAVEHLRQHDVDIAFLQEAALHYSHAHAKRQFRLRKDEAALHVVALADRVSVIGEPPLGEGIVLPVRIPELGIRILNAHAVYNTEERESHDYQGFRRCVDAIERYCDNYDGPLLVVGDFNASVHLKYDVSQFRALFHRLAEMGLHDQACDEECGSSLAGTCWRQHPPTRTYRAKDYRIDYIFANDAARSLTSLSRVGDHGSLSDHRPVFAEVRGA